MFKDSRRKNIILSILLIIFMCVVSYFVFNSFNNKEIKPEVISKELGIKLDELDKICENHEYVLQRRAYWEQFHSLKDVENVCSLKELDYEFYKNGHEAEESLLNDFYNDLSKYQDELYKDKEFTNPDEDKIYLSYDEIVSFAKIYENIIISVQEQFQDGFYKDSFLEDARNTVDKALEEKCYWNKYSSDIICEGEVGE